MAVELCLFLDAIMLSALCSETNTICSFGQSLIQQAEEERLNRLGYPLGAASPFQLDGFFHNKRMVTFLPFLPGQRKSLTRVGIEPTTFGLDLRRSTD